MAHGGGGAGNKFKLIFVGDQSVGKTGIITRFMFDTFEENYQATVGMDLLSKSINVGSTSVRLQLWDTAGQERFRALIPSYFRDASCALVVFDLSSSTSFTKTKSWIDEVRKERGASIFLVLVGNKVDLTDTRAVSKDDAEAQAAEYGAVYFETSAKTGANIVDMFKFIASELATDPTNKGPQSASRPEGTKLEDSTDASTDVPPPSNCKC